MEQFNEQKSGDIAEVGEYIRFYCDYNGKREGRVVGTKPENDAIIVDVGDKEDILFFAFNGEYVIISEQPGSEAEREKSDTERMAEQIDDIWHNVGAILRYLDNKEKGDDNDGSTE